MNNDNTNNLKDTDVRDGGLRGGGPDSYAGFVANDADGDSSIGHPAKGDSHSGINSNFAKAAPESNVGPAGTPQASHGHATGDVPGGSRPKAPGEPDGAAADGGADTSASESGHDR